MPPGPAFNWLCVLSSAADILGHAARIRVAQLPKTPLTRPGRIALNVGRVPATEPTLSGDIDASSPSLAQNNVFREEPDRRTPLSETATPLVASDLATPSEAVEILPLLRVTPVPRKAEHAETVPRVARDIPLAIDSEEIGRRTENDEAYPLSPNVNAIPVEKRSEPSQSVEEISPPLEEPPTVYPLATLEATPPTNHLDPRLTVAEPVKSTRNLQASKVPSSRLARLVHYGGLAASLGYGAASEVLRRSTSAPQDNASSVMMSEANIKRLVSKLSQMRGAALKLGQFMSIQDTHLLPPEVDKIFRRVQDSAHYMPDWQMEEVLRTSIGPTWSDSFTSFERVPFAAASIGQVHSATLQASNSPTGDAAAVAVKIQFPNITNSIESDLGYIKMLLTAGRLLPKGLFLDRTIQVMKQELADECDYAREAGFLRRFKEFLRDDPRYKVPWVWEGSTDRVLVMEHVNGVSVGEADSSALSQQDRNDISAWILELCIKELFEFRVMQTDPNWTNFLWNAQTRQVELVDFGATREYSKEFMDDWLRLLQAAASEDRDACVQYSLKLGYLTGEEKEIMVDAHVNSMVLLAAPFRASTPQPFSFGQGTQWADITAQIREQIPVMLQHRLTPPPRETYSLNRKLSGAFLLASRLRATVDTKAIWDSVVQKYEFST